MPGNNAFLKFVCICHDGIKKKTDPSIAKTANTNCEFYICYLSYVQLIIVDCSALISVLNLEES